MSKIQKLEKQLKKERAKELYVSAYSPGTFVSESSSYKVEDKCLKTAIKKISKTIERHGAKPYGFRFEDGNGKSLGGMYYVTGRLIKFEEISDNDEELSILKLNMRCNNFPIVIENKNSYRFTGPFNPEDCIIDWAGNVVQEGNAPELEAYRSKMKKVFADYYKKL